MSYSQLVRDKNGRWTKKSQIVNSKFITICLLIAFLMFGIAYYAHANAPETSSYQRVMSRKIKFVNLTEQTEVCIKNELETYCALDETLLIDSIKRDSKPEIKPAQKLAPKASYIRKGNNLEVMDMIRQEAQKQGYADVELALDIADCESRYNPLAEGTNKDGTKDRGVFQLNNYWHSHISNQCAFDASCNIQYAIGLLKDGKAHLWSCYRKVR